MHFYFRFQLSANTQLYLKLQINQNYGYQKPVRKKQLATTKKHHFTFKTYTINLIISNAFFERISINSSHLLQTAATHKTLYCPREISFGFSEREICWLIISYWCPQSRWRRTSTNRTTKLGTPQRYAIHQVTESRIKNQCDLLSFLGITWLHWVLLTLDSWLSSDSIVLVIFAAHVTLIIFVLLDHWLTVITCLDFTEGRSVEMLNGKLQRWRQNYY